MTPDELLKSISEAERTERVARGLPPHHVLDMAEFPFCFASKTFKRFAAATAQWASQSPDDPGPQSINAWARVLVGDYAGADAALARFQALMPDQPLAAMRFTSLPGGAPLSLPPVVGKWPDQPAFFISCDLLYLRKYGLNLLRSLAHHAPGCAAHVHVLGPDAADLSDINLALTVTTEDPAPIFATGLDPKIYYHAARLVRFAQALRASGQPLVASDADALVTADPRALLTLPGDVAIRVRPGRIEPWHHFSACLLRGTPQSIPYFDAVTEIILRLLSKPFWGLDQYALFAAYLNTKQALTLLGPDVASVESDKPGLFWFTAGVNKAELANASDPYAKAFRGYS